MSKVLKAFSRLFVTISKYHTMADVASMRVSYEPTKRLTIESSPKEPMELFQQWFSEARTCEAIREANAMTLATATKDGVPSARMVLLKGFDEEGFRFFTNYESRKGKELSENSNAALLFYWEPLEKQIRIEGTAERIPEAASDSYFTSRPHASQIGASVSNQSKPISNRQVLLDRFEELKVDYPTGATPIERPKHWGGFLLKPSQFEFWQGESNRLHTRINYIQSAEKPAPESLFHEGKNGWYFRMLSP